MNTDELVNRFRNFLRNNNVAREAFENGVGEIFDELRGGTNCRSSPNGNELKIKILLVKFFEQRQLQDLGNEHL